MAIRTVTSGTQGLPGRGGSVRGPAFQDTGQMDWWTQREQADKNREAQLRLGMYPEQARMERFSAIYPLLTGLLGNVNSQVGGQSPPSPEITVGPVWSNQAVQQRVNAQNAANQQAGATQERLQRRQAAGRGLASSSPLLAALGQQTQQGVLSANTAGERELRTQARQDNASQVLRSQQAREQQFASRQQEDIERRRTLSGTTNALIAALAGLA